MVLLKTIPSGRFDPNLWEWFYVLRLLNLQNNTHFAHPSGSIRMIVSLYVVVPRCFFLLSSGEFGTPVVIFSLSIFFLSFFCWFFVFMFIIYFFSFLPSCPLTVRSPEPAMIITHQLSAKTVPSVVRRVMEWISRAAGTSLPGWFRCGLVGCICSPFAQPPKLLTRFPKKTFKSNAKPPDSWETRTHSLRVSAEISTINFLGTSVVPSTPEKKVRRGGMTARLTRALFHYRRDGMVPRLWWRRRRWRWWFWCNYR